MKTLQEILSKINMLDYFLADLKKEYYRLHQIDMLSGEGDDLRGKIAKAEGEIASLKWMIYESLIKQK